MAVNKTIHTEKLRNGEVIEKSFFLELAEFSEPIKINGVSCETCEQAIKVIAAYINERAGENND